VLEDGGARLLEHGIAGPADLRAWLYCAVNGGGQGYLDPEAATLFWQAQSRALGFRRDDLQKLTLLDQPEEAVLVRAGPPPAAADVMAAYNARAQTTLLRSAREIRIHCETPAPALERAARAWADPLEVEWRVEAGSLILAGRADALGSWTRHGRRVERAALELLALPDLAPHELQGRLTIGDRECTFLWKQRDTLVLLGAGRGAPLEDGLPNRIAALATALRRERDRSGDSAWAIRRATHLISVEGAVFLPHLELRRGDLSLYLRLQGPQVETGEPEPLAPFSGKTPIGLVQSSGTEHDPLTLHLAGQEPVSCGSDALLAALATHLTSLLQAPRVADGPRRPLKHAA
jgi:hypothetical protein